MGKNSNFILNVLMMIITTKQIIFSLRRIPLHPKRLFFLSPRNALSQKNWDFSTDSREPSETRQPSEKLKRKVALVVSYVGTNYYGLQMDKNSSLPTVESTLESALSSSDYIRESNRRDLSKIDWSRSSRTDKKVHAAALVISTKLELKREVVSDSSIPYNHIPELVAEVNGKLPEDVKVLSCIRVNQGFRARQACNWREYEYVFPASMLQFDSDNMGDTDKCISLLNEQLKLFEGSKSFHNFHKLSQRALFQKPSERRPWVSSSDDARDVEDDNDNISYDDDDNPDIGDVAVTEKGTFEINPEYSLDNETSICNSTSNVDGNITARTPTFSYPIRSAYDSWEPRPRDIIAKTRCNIYKCEVLNRYDVNGMSMVKIRVCGQSFLLHQIRLMVGTAIAVVRGTLPSRIIETALASPYHILLPMAPAEGLVLVNSGFSKTNNGLAISLTPQRGMDLTLMDSQAQRAYEEFKTSRIYPQIVHDWSREDGLVARSWLDDCQRFQVPANISSFWEQDILQRQQEEDAAAAERRSNEAHRVNRFIDKFWDVLDAEKLPPPFVASDYMGTVGSKRTKVKVKKPEMFNHRIFLPNTLATELILTFRLYPSEDVFDGLRALATFMVEGGLQRRNEENSTLQCPGHDGLRPEMTAEEVVAWVVKRGGWAWLLDQPRHPQIE